MGDLGGNRRRGRSWKEFSPSKLSSRLADNTDAPRPDITGPDAEGWFIVAAADLKSDLSRRLDAVEQSAAINNFSRSAVVLYRRGRPSEPFVVMGLQTFHRVLTDPRQ